MHRIILLPVVEPQIDETVFAAALSAGRRFDAHFVALHVGRDPEWDAALLASGDPASMTMGSGLGLASVTEQWAADAEAHERAGWLRWSSFCEKNGIVFADAPLADDVVGSTSSGERMTAEWVNERGSRAEWLAALGRTADLIVVGHETEAGKPDFALMEAALLETGKPVLIVPSSISGRDASVLTDVVGIAWQDTREAAAAVRQALPFLHAARQVLVLTVTEPDAEDDESLHRLVRMLRWHNGNVSARSLWDDSRSPSVVLLEAAAAAGCGLLVMGGYGHTPSWEAVFGGFTRDVMREARLPVLMAH